MEIIDLLVKIFGFALFCAVLTVIARVVLREIRLFYRPPWKRDAP